MTWKAYIATSDLAQRREIGADIISFTGAARHLAGGEWDAQVVPTLFPVVERWMPLTPDQPSPVFVIMDGTVPLYSGPIKTAKQERQGAETKVTLSGVDDYAAVLGSRIIYPQPGDAPPWTTNPKHTVSGIASTAVSELIRWHRGDLAIDIRQGTPLDVIDTVAGPTGTWEFRLTPLDEAVAKIGRETGLTVSVVRRPTGGTIAVTVGPARNRSNLLLDPTKFADSTMSLSSATATTVIAGGTGEGTARLFAIAGETVAGDARIETFSDQRSITSQPQLQMSADANRAAGAASAAFGGSLTVEAAASYVWHSHYELGDTMRLKVGWTSWSVTVEAVTIEWDNNGQRVLPVLGTTPRHALAQLLRDVTGLANRVNDLEVS